MSTETSKMPISVTDKAAKFIKRMAEDVEAEANLCLKVLPGGCSGLKYSMEFIKEEDVRSTDTMVPAAHGVKIYIDNTSLPYLEGANIETDDDLLSPGLKIDNPNAEHSCGCGKSFN